MAWDDIALMIEKLQSDEKDKDSIIPLVRTYKNKVAAKCVACGLKIKREDEFIKFYSFMMHKNCFECLMVLRFPDIRKLTDADLREFSKKVIVDRI